MSKERREFRLVVVIEDSEGLERAGRRGQTPDDVARVIREFLGVMVVPALEATPGISFVDLV